jgi:hypothetical protein
MTTPQSGVAMYQAMDDFPGINFGGSAQYDTVGNEDDALDHDASGGISEGLTASVEFTAPATPGFKAGDQAINVEVADLLTEIANPKESMDPFPYPYFVAQDGDTLVVMVLETPSCDLEIVYDGTSYFGSSRASGFQTFQNGIKYGTDVGHTIVAVTHPGAGKIVKPVVRARTAGLTGQFSLTVFNFTISDITTGAAEKDLVVAGYQDAIPSDTTVIVDNDIDGDGSYNMLDPDIDGDGQINAEDRDPCNRNVQEEPPTGLQASVDKVKVMEGETFTLSATATDLNSDPLTFTWTVDKVPSWSETVQSLDVDAEGDFKPGTYVFSVMVTDGRSTVKPTDTVTVTIEEKSETSYVPYIIAISAIVILILVIAAFFYFRKKDDVDSFEEIPPKVTDDPKPVQPAIPVETKNVSPPVATPADQDLPPVETAEPADKFNTCPDCGASLEPNDTTCPGCGAEFEVVLECPTCQASIPLGSQNCPSCGLAFT